MKFYVYILFACFSMQSALHAAQQPEYVWKSTKHEVRITPEDIEITDISAGVPRILTGAEYNKALDELKSSGTEVILKAVSSGNKRIVQQLLKQGFDINKGSPLFGYQTPLMIIARIPEGHAYVPAGTSLRSTKILLELGADPNIKDGYSNKTAKEMTQNDKIRKAFEEYEKLQTPAHRAALRSAAQRAMEEQMKQQGQGALGARDLSAMVGGYLK